MSSLLRELRYAVRSLAKTPGFAAAAVLTLGLVSLAVGYLPARRAARVDPLLALRWE